MFPTKLVETVNESQMKAMIKCPMALFKVLINLLLVLTCTLPNAAVPSGLPMPVPDPVPGVPCWILWSSYHPLIRASTRPSMTSGQAREKRGGENEYQEKQTSGNTSRQNPLPTHRGSTSWRYCQICPRLRIQKGKAKVRIGDN